jgi:hypothetical protein
MAHKFGGIWTQKKLEILEQYLSFYSQALKNQGFCLHYVDAFAGTGSHNPETDDIQSALIPCEDLRGSVVTALTTSPAFHHYHFNDIDPEHIAALGKIRDEYPQCKINLTQLDANDFAPEFCSRLTPNDRAVIFLDPYSTQLNWETIENIAKSEKADIWLLFPISAILRLTPKKEDSLKESWRPIINRLLGTSDWESALYKPIEKPPISDLFDIQDESTTAARINVKELEMWITARLREVFAWAAEPILLTNNGKPLFLFYFAISNRAPKAVGLAKKVANQIIQKYKYRR